jgi:hypothetical protein
MEVLKTQERPGSSSGPPHFTVNLCPFEGQFCLLNSGTHPCPLHRTPQGILLGSVFRSSFKLHALTIGQRGTKVSQNISLLFGRLLVCLTWASSLSTRAPGILTNTNHTQVPVSFSMCLLGDEKLLTRTSNHLRNKTTQHGHD